MRGIIFQGPMCKMHTSLSSHLLFFLLTSATFGSSIRPREVTPAGLLERRPSSSMAAAPWPRLLCAHTRECARRHAGSASAAAQGSAPALASRGGPAAAPPGAPCSGCHLRPIAHLPSSRKVWRRDDGGTAGLTPPATAADKALETSHDEPRQQRFDSFFSAVASSGRQSSTGVRGKPRRRDIHENICVWAVGLSHVERRR
jgi:hypothetical protein